VDAFAQGRLLTQYQDTVEIIHEAPLSAWTRLRAWINDDRAGLIVLQRIEADAAESYKGGRDAVYLYIGTRLQTAREAYAAASWAHPAADATTRAFLAASHKAVEQARHVAIKRPGGRVLLSGQRQAGHDPVDLQPSQTGPDPHQAAPYLLLSVGGELGVAVANR
jgi:hypothetical protein